MAGEPFARFGVARTSDFDEAEEAMRSTAPGPGHGGGLNLDATRVGGLTVTYVRIGRDLHLETAEADNYHVSLPISGGTRSRSGRLERVVSTP
jgi:hypothetical protein